MTTRGRFGVAEPVVNDDHDHSLRLAADQGRLVLIDGRPQVLDILFRMLQPHELARAMGFPGDYAFTGTKEQQIRQIGNAVPVNTARALVRALFEGEGS
ncbi:hypothetical protein CCP1ISM_9970001 [Azospirillaceae bacterium]